MQSNTRDGAGRRLNTVTRNGRTLIYSIFQRGDTMFLVSTYWGIADPPMYVSVNGVRAVEHGINRYEPVRYFTVPALEDPSNITVCIDGVDYACFAEVVSSNPGEFAVTTLFKDDSFLLPRFIEHYRRQGVTAFHLYYNGATLPDGCPHAPDIHYHLWDFKYWNNTDERLMWSEWWHAAQTAMLTDVRLRYSLDYKWFGVVDLDEWVYVRSDMTLASYLATVPPNFTAVRTHCNWARLENDGIYYKIEGDRQRGKTIYRNVHPGLFGIHNPKVMSNVLESPHAKMLHVVINGTEQYERRAGFSMGVPTDFIPMTDLFAA